MLDEFELELSDEFELELSDEFELELSDEFELELSDEFELELLDEFELELLDEFELELLDEFELELSDEFELEPSSSATWTIGSDAGTTAIATASGAGVGAGCCTSEDDGAGGRSVEDSPDEIAIGRTSSVGRADDVPSAEKTAAALNAPAPPAYHFHRGFLVCFMDRLLSLVCRVSVEHRRRR
ncbi:MAG: hypothetical protein AB7Q42_21545 [Acidimicrobiia bacterium]